MADRLYKINEPIAISYQAPAAESGLVGVVAEIYLPNGQKDSSFPDVALVEIESTGNYIGTFTPNAMGTWRVIRHKADGGGQLPSAYSVGGYDVHTVGANVDAVSSKIDALDVKVSSWSAPGVAY